MSKDKAPICTQPFSLWNMKTEGFRACCNRHLPPQDLPGNPWNSEYQREFRKKMFSKKTLPVECHECSAYGHNSAMKYGADWKTIDYDYETGAVKGIPIMQYFLGNKCNLACDTCDTEHSDLHGKVFPDRIIPVKDVLKVDQLSEILLHQPASVVVYGGEPFMYRSFVDDCVAILENTDAQLSILTNGHTDLDKWDFWERVIKPFPQRTVMVFSCDGTPELNKEIRRGINQEQLDANIARCVADKTIITNVHFTISTLNIANLQGIYKYWVEMIKGGYDSHFDLCAVVKPHDMALHNLPRAQRDQLIEEIEDFVDDYVLVSLKDIKSQWLISSAIKSFEDMIELLDMDLEPEVIYGSNLNRIEVKIIE